MAGAVFLLPSVRNGRAAADPIRMLVSMSCSEEWIHRFSLRVVRLITQVNYLASPVLTHSSFEQSLPLEVA